MTVVVDAGFICALVRGRHPRHGEAVSLVEMLDEDLVTSPLALAEARASRDDSASSGSPISATPRYTLSIATW